MKVPTSLLGIALAFVVGSPLPAGAAISGPLVSPQIGQVPPRDDPDSVDGEDPPDSGVVDPSGPGVPPPGDDSDD